MFDLYLIVFSSIFCFIFLVVFLCFFYQNNFKFMCKFLSLLKKKKKKIFIGNKKIKSNDKKRNDQNNSQKIFRVLPYGGWTRWTQTKCSVWYHFSSEPTTWKWKGNESEMKGNEIFHSKIWVKCFTAHGYRITNANRISDHEL